MDKMKRIIIKYWWALPVLLALLMITLGLFFSLSRQYLK